MEINVLTLHKFVNGTANALSIIKAKGGPTNGGATNTAQAAYRVSTRKVEGCLFLLYT